MVNKEKLKALSSLWIDEVLKGKYKSLEAHIQKHTSGPMESPQHLNEAVALLLNTNPIRSYVKGRGDLARKALTLPGLSIEAASWIRRFGDL